ncbi:uncharacterized protein LOC126744777 [Anthonomus grandis grandis]|uniref:uncharacterized protein LOC126744777 n=1 Tax=Anthonomus grandis grandis TaxID=2921223 RepID=UPI00216655E3|nr:uncharacterized protein LOC126744777 [Anthonomus grandis grandis]
MCSLLLASNFLRITSANILTISRNMSMWSVGIKSLIGICTGLFCAGETLFFFYRILVNFDVDFMMQFAPFSFNNCYAAIIIVQTICKYSSFKNLTNYIDKHFWSLDNAETEAQNEISIDMKIFKYLMVTSVGVVIITATVYMPGNGIYDDQTMFVLIEWLHHGYFPEYVKYIVMIVNFLKLFPQAYFMLTYLFQLCFFINSYRYQTILIKWKLINITKDLSKLNTKSEMYYNEAYQTAIKRRLINCIKQHIILSQYAEKVINYFYYTLLWQIMSGIIVFVSLIYIFMFHNSYNKQSAVITNIVGVYFASFFYTLYGQLFQDQNDILLEATMKSNWENFNKSNKKTLLIFMINLKRSYILVGLGIIPVNFDMFIWFCNKVVALLGVIEAME